MDSSSKLEETIDKILTRSESEILAGLTEAHSESEEKIAKSQSFLEEEYDRILDEGKKEADKIAKQIVGGSDLKARNRQLLLVQESITRVFEKAVEKVDSARRDADYSKLVSALVDEAIGALGTSDVVIYASAKDRDAVQSVLGGFAGAKLSSETIECLGGIRAKSKDGSMSYDNTIDSRIERMKPLIRKEIAAKFGIGD